jgi:hypothetical protein
MKFKYSSIQRNKTNKHVILYLRAVKTRLLLLGYLKFDLN